MVRVVIRSVCVQLWGGGDWDPALIRKLILPRTITNFSPLVRSDCPLASLLIGQDCLIPASDWSRREDRSESFHSAGNREETREMETERDAGYHRKYLF